jgi:hypothetical protein
MEPYDVIVNQPVVIGKSQREMVSCTCYICIVGVLDIKFV